MLVLCASTTAQSAMTFVPNRILVKPFDAEAFRAMLPLPRGLFIDAPLHVREIGGSGSFLVESSDAEAHALLEAFVASAMFEITELDSIVSAHARVIPEDPEFEQATERFWGLDAILAPRAWLRGQGDKSTVVAVIDSGLDAEHEDLVENLWEAPASFQLQNGEDVLRCRAGTHGLDVVDDDCDPEEREKHGTHVSGIIGARGDNAKGTVGVVWRVSLLPIALLDHQSPATASRAARAIDLVRQLKESGVADIRVVNLSWGTHHDSRTVEEALVRLAAQDVVIVTSSGNDGADSDSTPVFPAGYSRVPTLINVAGTGNDGNIARSSNRGRQSVHLAAPSISIRTTAPGQSYDSPFGTSMAAALVTGAVALVSSQCRELSALELKALILETAERRPSLASHVAEGRFLNVLAASEECALSQARARTGSRAASAR